MEWQPIETHQAKAVLLHDPILICGGVVWQNGEAGPEPYKSVTIGIYSGSPDFKGFDYMGENAGGNRCYYWHKPAYWKPLDAPPDLGLLTWLTY